MVLRHLREVIFALDVKQDITMLVPRDVDAI